LEVFSLWFQGRLTTEGGVRELIEDNSLTAVIYRRDEIRMTAEAVWTGGVDWIEE